MESGELHENLVAGDCANEDVTNVSACRLVFAAVRFGVQSIARVVRADIRYNVQTPLRKSRWEYRSGTVIVGPGEKPEPPVNYALRFIWAAADVHRTEAGERVLNGCGEIDVN